ncbi:hypothetical protein M3P05_10185 [Sansalvadorimonas sp. 2012CJ34-2]|uniref:SET domain-containing protein n=1 Tax=Parendozoicomonas callyspongiae TaxID=2942213 RepID=A0ABT0PFY8_9GAMM|nr:hypothetical protein [Sansalvadorimonas sp. 2012CJ34-2]MCL6270289.1 hypothetical protein [Sansalvadorimonas sp. 2012CJ34-2]
MLLTALIYSNFTSAVHITKLPPYLLSVLEQQSDIIVDKKYQHDFGCTYCDSHSYTWLYLLNKKHITPPKRLMNTQEIGAIEILKELERISNEMTRFRLYRYVGNCQCDIGGMCVTHSLHTLLRDEGIRYVDLFFVPIISRKLPLPFVRIKINSLEYFIFIDVKPDIPEERLMTETVIMPEDRVELDKRQIDLELLDDITLALEDLFERQKFVAAEKIEVFDHWGHVAPLEIGGRGKLFVYKREGFFKECDDAGSDSGFSEGGNSLEGADLTNDISDIEKLDTKKQKMENNKTKTHRQIKKRKAGKTRMKALLEIDMGSVPQLVKYKKEEGFYNYPLYAAQSKIPGCRGKGVFAADDIPQWSVIGIIKSKLHRRGEKPRINSAANRHKIFVDDDGNYFDREPGKKNAFRWLNMALNMEKPEESPIDNITLYTPCITGSDKDGWIGDTLVLAKEKIKADDELLFSYDTKPGALEHILKLAAQGQLK